MLGNFWWNCKILIKGTEYICMYVLCIYVFPTYNSYIGKSNVFRWLFYRLVAKPIKYSAVYLIEIDNPISVTQALFL